MTNLRIFGRRDRKFVTAIAASCLVLLLAAGYSIVNSLSMSRVADDAAVLQWVASVFRVSDLVRSGLLEATQAGIAGDSSVDELVAQVGVAHAELEQLAVLGDDRDSYGDLVRYAASSENVTDALDRHDWTAASLLADTEDAELYTELGQSLRAEEQTVSDALAAGVESGGATSSWLLFVLVLAIPASAVGLSLVGARRRIRSHQKQVEVEIETIRAVDRAKDEYIAALSHELRTPLTSIFGYATIQADRGIQGADEVQETGRIIAAEAAEMTRMVDDLLMASRLTSVGVEMVDCGPTRLQDVVESAASLFERAGMVIEREPTTARVEADAARLRQVLINLLSNAVRHGGPEVGINVSATDDRVEIEVWDNGEGLSDAQVQTMFSPAGHQPPRPLLVGRAGLGLAVASNLTALMGGGLRYQRFANRTFFIIGLKPAAYESEADTDDVASMIRALSA